MGRKNHSPLSFLCQERLNFEEDDNLIEFMQDSAHLNNKIHKIEKNLK